MALKPWYSVVTPREDLREGKPLDASEFAVNLEQIRHGIGEKDYTDPRQFFERTFMTRNLTELAAEVIRRLAGETTETSAVFNMATQFGGGKTHALTLLYHLAKNGSDADDWQGVGKLLDRAKVNSIPQAAAAVFVGLGFDSFKGRGGSDGTPLRKTPWGEIAFQLGGEEAFALVAKHDELGQAPGGDVIRDFLPDKPCLILMDELMNYITRHRKSGLSAQLYTFLQNLSEEARGRKGVVLAVSIPASELEMTAEDQADYDRIVKLLDRLGKPVKMSTDNEMFEIIRRRLFEWDSSALDQSGKVLLTKDAQATCREFGTWFEEHRDQLPKIFNTENIRQEFADTYPFHPVTLSVFERKWQALPSFQRTRGVLRMMALWVSSAYKKGYEGAHKDPLISLGTAPLNSDFFRNVVFKQLGEDRLETAVLADISGETSHAFQLDKSANDAIRKGRLHQKVATTVFFESNGGQSKAYTNIGEIRAAVGEPGLDIGNIETVLEELVANAYYLSVEGPNYRFGLVANLNKILSDKRAAIDSKEVEARVRQEVTDVFKKGAGIERVYFPEKSNQITDRPVLTLVVGDPSSPLSDQTKSGISQMIAESGQSARTFKSALIWAVPDSGSTLSSDAKKVLAWEAIEDDTTVKIEESQKGQLRVNIEKARRDLKESVWRAYKHIVMLDKDNSLRVIDLGLVNSSGYDSLSGCFLKRLKDEGDVQESISPNFLVRNWSPVYDEWSVKSVRDAFFASPLFPKLLSGDSIKQTIANGVSNGQFAYVIKSGDKYEPFRFKQGLMAGEVEIADDVYILKKELAEKYEESLKSPTPASDNATIDTKITNDPPAAPVSTPPTPDPGVEPPPLFKQTVQRIFWSGELSSQKWSLFYQKVLMKHVGPNLKVSVKFESAPDEGVSLQKVGETKSALRELGLTDDVATD